MRNPGSLGPGSTELWLKPGKTRYMSTKPSQTESKSNIQNLMQIEAGLPVERVVISGCSKKITTDEGYDRRKTPFSE